MNYYYDFLKLIRKKIALKAYVIFSFVSHVVGAVGKTCLQLKPWSRDVSACGRLQLFKETGETGGYVTTIIRKIHYKCVYECKHSINSYTAKSNPKVSIRNVKSCSHCHFLSAFSCICVAVCSFTHTQWAFRHKIKKRKICAVFLYYFYANGQFTLTFTNRNIFMFPASFCVKRKCTQKMPV